MFNASFSESTCVTVVSSLRSTFPCTTHSASWSSIRHSFSASARSGIKPSAQPDNGRPFHKNAAVAEEAMRDMDAFGLGFAVLAALALLLAPPEWQTLTADLTLPRC